MANYRILSWNVNGIRAVQRKGNLDELLRLGEDILCFQETKAQPDQLDSALLAPDGYHAYYSSAERKGYSGVSLFSKREPVSLQYGLGIDRFDLEGRTIIADYGDFLLLNHYYPNGKASDERLRYKMDFYDACLEFTNNLVAQGRNVVVCGDVNTAHHPIDLARPEANETVSGFLPIEREWITKFLANGYIDTFRLIHPDEPDQYTWWSLQTGARARNVGWRIDYFFVNEALKHAVKDAWIMMDFMGSDHCPIGIELEV
ncbi:MAG: exodeoxyribonuclease III [Anaerolineae bacterium]|nr:exodeoxyribonuclease III [Anaerolineae bacterium]